MQDYKPNSNRFKEEQKAAEKKKVEKVVSGKARVKKKSGVRKFADSFVSEEAANVGSYILSELIIPTVKQTIVDGIKNSAEMIFLGKVSDRNSRRVGSSASYVSYNRYSDRRDDRYEPKSRGSYNPDDIVFDSRRDAEDVLQQMDGIMAEYGLVKVADLYDLAGLTCPHTSNRYGWTNIRNAEVVRISDGYIIKLPRAIPLD